jgi:hypothetical protein
MRKENEQKIGFEYDMDIDGIEAWRPRRGRGIGDD